MSAHVVFSSIVPHSALFCAGTVVNSLWCGLADLDMLDGHLGPVQDKVHDCIHSAWSV